jgi:hypothetical protein
MENKYLPQYEAALDRHLKAVTAAAMDLWAVGNEVGSSTPFFRIRTGQFEILIHDVDGLSDELLD